MTTISTVLFDADGVIQLPAANWRRAWGTLISEGADVDLFLDDIFAAEEPYLLGGKGFENDVIEVLTKWRSAHSFEDALRVWAMIEPDKEILELVRDISSAGLRVGLATNQQSHRYEYMMSALDYHSIFDEFFVSFMMGVRKPSVDYFQQILERLECSGAEVLFFDDSEPNVKTARSVGINAEVYHLSEGKEKMVYLLQAYGV